MELGLRREAQREPEIRAGSQGRTIHPQCQDSEEGFHDQAAENSKNDSTAEAAAARREGITQSKQADSSDQMRSFPKSFRQSQTLCNPTFLYACLSSYGRDGLLPPEVGVLVQGVG